MGEEGPAGRPFHDAISSSSGVTAPCYALEWDGFFNHTEEGMGQKLLKKRKKRQVERIKFARSEDTLINPFLFLPQ